MLPGPISVCSIFLGCMPLFLCLIHLQYDRDLKSLITPNTDFRVFLTCLWECTVNILKPIISLDDTIITSCILDKISCVHHECLSFCRGICYWHLLVTGKWLAMMYLVHSSMPRIHTRTYTYATVHIFWLSASALSQHYHDPTLGNAHGSSVRYHSQYINPID